MQRLYYCLGTTCAGKTWLMERAQQRYPEIFGLVEVGKIFRQRYSPDYFKGSAAPEHTEREAVAIFQEEMAKQASKPVVLVSGQPRRVSQIKPTIQTYPGTALLIYAEEEELRRRAGERGSQADIELSMARINNDRIQLYDVLFHLIEGEYNLETLRSTPESVDNWIEDQAFHESA